MSDINLNITIVIKLISILNIIPWNKLILYIIIGI